MKSFFSVFLVFVMLLGCSVGVADMGVQIIGGPETETGPVSLDDIQLHADVSIDGYGVLTPSSFEVVDLLGYYDKGDHNLDYDRDDYYSSGAEAEFAILKMDIMNTSISEKNFLADCEVKAVYDDVYEYGGWCHQYNWNNESNGNDGYINQGEQNTSWVIDREDWFGIGPMYVGHYAFGATLPNAVINSKAPLRLVITIDGNEITYNIRK